MPVRPRPISGTSESLMSPLRLPQSHPPVSARNTNRGRRAAAAVATMVALTVPNMLHAEQTVVSEGFDAQTLHLVILRNRFGHHPVAILPSVGSGRIGGAQRDPHSACAGVRPYRFARRRLTQSRPVRAMSGVGHALPAEHRDRPRTTFQSGLRRIHPHRAERDIHRSPDQPPRGIRHHAADHRLRAVAPGEPFQPVLTTSLAIAFLAA